MTERIVLNNGLAGGLDWLNDRPIFASISGGKDSTAMGLWLQSKGVKFTPVFLDTGWEHPATYEYIKNDLTSRFGEFLILRNEKYFKDGSTFAGGMEQLVERNKMFPNGRIKFCTRELKIVPIQNYYSLIYAKYKKKPVNVLGIRREESLKRSKMTEREERDEATVWRPLIDWTYEDVIEAHQEAKISPNPLYLKGYSRVGCYPCIFARKHEVRHVALSDPGRVDHIRDLEARVSGLRDDGQRATFFKSKKKGVDKMAIDEIVDWSKSKGGDLLNDQDEIEEAGCMRWGLCDTSTLERIKSKEEVDLFNWREKP